MDGLMRHLRLQRRPVSVIARRRDVGGWPGSEKAGVGLGLRPASPVSGRLSREHARDAAYSHCGLHQEEDWFIAQCLEVDVASQSHTIDEALANLAEAVELYLEEVDDPAGHIAATPLVTSFHLPAA
jgi:predicted RNase H-like HicB family nuclease